MAISATVTATKIDITSTGGEQVTFGAVVTAVNAVTAGTITGSGTVGDPYTITASSYRELELSDGCNVLFEANTYIQWQWDNTSSTYTICDFASGSTVTIEEGCNFDFGYTGTYHRAYIYTYGKLYINGVSGNQVIWKNYRSWYDYTNDEVDIDYLTLQDISYASGYFYYFENYQTTSNEISRLYNHVTVTNTGANIDGYIAFQYFGNPICNSTWSNWTVTNIDYILLYVTTAKLTNWTVDNLNYYVNILGSGHSVGSRYETSKNDAGFSEKYFQPSLMLEGWNFGLSTDYTWIVYNRFGSQIYLKNCEFSTDNIYTNYGAKTLEYGDSTISAATTPRTWATDGTYLRVRELDITVQDKDGNPIEAACVILAQQPDRKEEHCGFTNSDGKLLDIFGNGAKVVEREETSKDVFENWSNDLAGGTAYHSLTVSKCGYGTYTTTFEATEDKTFVITLYPAAGHPTTIINSTLYDTTIN